MARAMGEANPDVVFAMLAPMPLKGQAEVEPLIRAGRDGDYRYLSPLKLPQWVSCPFISPSQVKAGMNVS
jgi:hypothetical protein